MFMFLGILSFLLFLVMLVVSINPKWISRGEKKYTRKQTLLSAGVMFVLFCIFAINDGSNNSAAALSPSASAVTAPVKTPEQIAIDKAAAEAKVTQDAADKVVADAKAKVDAEAKAKQDAADKVIADAKAVEDKKVADAKAAAAVEAAKPKHIAYKELARNPDSYVGTNVIFTGKVIQVQESGKLVNLRVNVTKNTYGYEDTVMIQYDKGIVSGRVLDDDVITFSGMSMGLLTYKTVMGAEMTIPQVLVTTVALQ